MTSHKGSYTSERLLNVDELAGYLGVSAQSIRHMVHRRQIPFIRLGARRVRFDQAEITAWVNAQRVDVA
jgi:excisionase family DNA binding protein